MLMCLLFNVINKVMIFELSKVSWAQKSRFKIQLITKQTKTIYIYFLKECQLVIFKTKTDHRQNFIYNWIDD